MAIKLIAMDLDGTLLNSDKLLTERTLKAIAKAQEKGVYTTIATGRMFLSAVYFGRKINANAPIVCCNGGMVQGMDEEKPLFARYLTSDVVARILTMSREHGWYSNWYIGPDIYVEDYRPDFFFAYRTVENFKVKEVGDRFLDYTDGVFQCVVRDDNGKINDAVKLIAQSFTPEELKIQENTGWSVDLTPPDVSKALGLSALAESLGIKPEEVMACGDADNDLAMLKWAGTSVVPANGSEEAKELATYHTDSCDEDGIGKAIEELVLKG